MYSEQLETLIKNVLADGVITDKERAVLHKKAEAEGVDVDEIDVYIDGELEKIRNEQQKVKSQVCKCPSCGEIINVLEGVCPSCGHIMTVDKNDLLEILENLESCLADLKGSTDDPDKKIALVEKHKRKAKMLYGDNQKVKYLLNEIDVELATQRKSWKKKFIKRKMTKFWWATSLIFIVVAYFIGMFCYHTVLQIEVKYETTKFIKQIESLEEPTPQNIENVYQAFKDFKNNDNIREIHNPCNWLGCDYLQWNWGYTCPVQATMWHGKESIANKLKAYGRKVARAYIEKYKLDEQIACKTAYIVDEVYSPDEQKKYYASFGVATDSERKKYAELSRMLIPIKDIIQEFCGFSSGSMSDFFE